MSVEERAEYQRVERAAMLEQDRETFQALAEVSVCRGCGCSDTIGCPSICGWAKVKGMLLCTACDDELGPEDLVRQPYPDTLLVPPGRLLSELLSSWGHGWFLVASPREPQEFLACWPMQDGFTVVAVP